MSGARDSFDRIRSQAEKVRGSGDSFTCRCSAHEDRDPSLSVKLDGDRVLLHCHAGCEAESVVRAFGLELRDLFDRSTLGGGFDPSRPAPRRSRTSPTADPTPKRTTYEEAAGIAQDAENDEAHRAPIPVSGLATALDMAKYKGGDRGCIAQLRAVANGEEWARLDPVERAILTDWAADRAGRRWRAAVALTLGTVDRTGRYRPAPAEAPPAPPLPDSLADMPPVTLATTVAHDVFYAGKLGLIHGPSGGGKSTLAALAVAAVTRGVPFMRRPTRAGTIIVCTEDPDTWHDVVSEAGGDLACVKVRPWPSLPAAVRELQSVAVAIDTMQHVAHVAGAGELDSAMEVDRILRPLEALARETGTAITVLDHEPWEDRPKVSGNRMTKGRPRHSGAKVATSDFVMACDATKDADGRIETITIGPSKAKGARRGIVVTCETIGVDGQPAAPQASAGAEVDAERQWVERWDTDNQGVGVNHCWTAFQQAFPTGRRSTRDDVRDWLKAARADRANPTPPHGRTVDPEAVRPGRADPMRTGSAQPAQDSRAAVRTPIGRTASSHGPEAVRDGMVSVRPDPPINRGEGDPEGGIVITTNSPTTAASASPGEATGRGAAMTETPGAVLQADESTAGATGGGVAPEGDVAMIETIDQQQPVAVEIDHRHDDRQQMMPPAGDTPVAATPGSTAGAPGAVEEVGAASPAVETTEVETGGADAGTVTGEPVSPAQGIAAESIAENASWMTPASWSDDDGAMLARRRLLNAQDGYTVALMPTPGGPGNYGKQLMFPDAVRFERALDPAELEADRRTVEAATWRTTHNATA